MVHESVIWYKQIGIPGIFYSYMEPPIFHINFRLRWCNKSIKWREFFRVKYFAWHQHRFWWVWLTYIFTVSLYFNTCIRSCQEQLVCMTKKSTDHQRKYKSGKTFYDFVDSQNGMTVNSLSMLSFLDDRDLWFSFKLYHKPGETRADTPPTMNHLLWI